MKEEDRGRKTDGGTKMSEVGPDQLLVSHISRVSGHTGIA